MIICELAAWNVYLCQSDTRKSKGLCETLRTNVSLT